MTYMALDKLPEPGERYTLEAEIAKGVFAKVYRARDNESNGKLVAIKIQRFDGELKTFIDGEYRVLRDFSTHPNLPEFLGVYRKRKDRGPDEIWFILEYCEGGSAIDLVRRLYAGNKRVTEHQIAYILREAARAANHLHENNVIHRDIRGSNILITKSGEIKLCDFGLACEFQTQTGKRSTCIGSPSWMAPEIINNSVPQKNNDKKINHSNNDNEEDEEYDEEQQEQEHADDNENADDRSGSGKYDSRADVWAIGITAIEIGDGKAPFLDMHPTRAMFQILRNPPPTLWRPSNWTNNYNDFIAECLEKNPENRPFMGEIIEHPFFCDITADTGSDTHLITEIKHLLEIADSISDAEREQFKKQTREETIVMTGYMKTFNKKPEKMYVEDLAALDEISDKIVVEQLRNRVLLGETYSFIGDVLLSVNSNDMSMDFDKDFHNRYICKSRSENSPHIFAVADSAYQDMLHHEQPQHIIMAGESYSGKTANVRLGIRHLAVMGAGNPGIDSLILCAMKAIQCLTNAGTPVNPDSTRCASQTQLTFGKTGKLTGAIFWIYLLEKLRVSSTDMNQANFHIFYYFYDAMAAEKKLDQYYLEEGRHYRYLRIPNTEIKTKLVYCRYDVDGNLKRFNEFKEWMERINLTEDVLQTMYRVLAAILLLGEVRFQENGKFAEIENVDVLQKISKLLMLDERKFQWAIVNYCLITSGTAARRQLTCDEARDARDVLASTLYLRLVDWIVNIINQRLALGRAVFGDIYMITFTDIFGFECFHRNRTEQLLINCLNEQFQYHYNQRMFCWEMYEQEEEQIPVTALRYYDNKLAVDHLMSKPHGLFYVMDDATRGRQQHDFITDSVANLTSAYVKRVSAHEISIAHYSGRVTYDCRDLPDINRDFLSPEMVETLRASKDSVVKLMFTNQLSKSGNLTVAFVDDNNKSKDKKSDAVASSSSSSSDERSKTKAKWGEALVSEKQKGKKLNTLSQGQYSQIHKMRTLSSVFRATSLEILKGLSVGGNSGNTHFVRCIRADLDYKPRGFQDDMVSQQLRALAILDTAVARQKGYPHRISFQEFLRRYQFLAFDFDENVEITKDNCRLLLIRLKMEGWAIGKSKVFLKYYNVEFLSRLYETQVKKIIKVQSMMRAFLAKKKITDKTTKLRQDSVDKSSKKGPTEDEAAIAIQKAYRGYMTRRKYGPLINEKTGEIDATTSKFVKDYAKKWKSRTIFQVLLHYRAARYQDFVNLSQQVHLYNQRANASLKACNMELHMEKIDPHDNNPVTLGSMLPAVRKLPFRLSDIPFFDTTYMCDPTHPNHHKIIEDDESWDAPFRRTGNVSSHITNSTSYRRRGFAPLPPDTIYENAREYGDHGYVERQNSISKKQRAPQPNQNYISTQLNNTKNNTIINNNTYDNTNDNNNSDNNINKNNNNNNNNYNNNNYNYNNYNNNNNNKEKPKLNPVNEMQMIANQRRAGGNTENGDDPPFNFQGMLRKTHYNRESMKRTTNDVQNYGNHYNVDDNNMYSSQSNINHNNNNYGRRMDMIPPKISINNYSNNNNNNNNNNNINNNNNNRNNHNSNNNEKEDVVFVNEENVPGMIVEGDAVEI